MDQSQQASPLAIVIAIVVLLVVLFAIYQLTLAKHMPSDDGGQATVNAELSNPAHSGEQPDADNALVPVEPATNAL
jgi:hypothetical protein